MYIESKHNKRCFNEQLFFRFKLWVFLCLFQPFHVLNSDTTYVVLTIWQPRDNLYVSVCVSSPYSSPHTEGRRPCHRTACPAGGDDSSNNRNSWSGRVYPWLWLLAVYGTEPRHTSHRPLKWEGEGRLGRGRQRERVRYTKRIIHKYIHLSTSSLHVLITV